MSIINGPVYEIGGCIRKAGGGKLADGSDHIQIQVGLRLCPEVLAQMSRLVAIARAKGTIASELVSPSFLSSKTHAADLSSGDVFVTMRVSQVGSGWLSVRLTPEQSAEWGVGVLHAATADLSVQAMVQTGDLALLRAFLESVELSSEDLTEALSAAAGAARSDMVLLLLSHGAQIEGNLDEGRRMFIASAIREGELAHAGGETPSPSIRQRL